MKDLNSFFSFLNRKQIERKQIQSLLLLLYEFKKLPTDILGKKARITGKIGDMDVDLTLEFEPEPLKYVLSMFDFLKKYYEEQKKALKKVKK